MSLPEAMMLMRFWSKSPHLLGNLPMGSKKSPPSRYASKSEIDQLVFEYGGKRG